MTWPWLAVLAGGTWLLKAAGPVLAGERRLPAHVNAVVMLLPPALLAALVAVQTAADGQSLVVDARVAALAVAAVAVWRRAPFLMVIGLATATAALLRWAGAP